MVNRILFISITLSLFLLPLHAQKHSKKDSLLNRTVVVEQQYKPVVSDASKINILPPVTKPTIKHQDVEYATRVFLSENIPPSIVPVYRARDIKSEYFPGYVKFGYGNQGNVEGKAKYTFRLSDIDFLKMKLDFAGMKGNLDMPFGEERTWNAFFYRTRAMAGYSHQFEKMDLGITTHFGTSNFNYEPLSFKKQNFTSGDLMLTLKSTDEKEPFQYAGEVGLKLYGRQNNILAGSANENIFTAGLSASYSFDDVQSLGAKVKAQTLSYNNDSLSNYTTIDVNPFYEVKTDDWHLHLGAHTDYSFSIGQAIQIAPDVNIQFIPSEGYVLYVAATGGKKLNDFRRLEQVNPFGTIDKTLSDTYERYNLSAGFKASPIPELWLHFFGGYQRLHNDLYCYEAVYERQYVSFGLTSTKDFYGGLSLSYKYKDLFGFSFEGIYRDWKADADEALWMKPKLQLGFNTSYSPIKPLVLSLGYNYIQRAEDINLHYDKKINPVNELNLGASYAIWKNISVYASFKNVLNKEYQYYRIYPAQKFNFLFGVTLKIP